MASYSADRAKSATLSTTVADTVTLNGIYPYVAVTSRGAAAVTFHTDADAAVPTALADNCWVALNTQTVVAQVTKHGTNTTVVKIVGNGDSYTIVGLTEKP